MTALSSAIIDIALVGWWSAGSGASAGGDVDRGVVREYGTGLPYLPARQLKGHLRESAGRLAEAQAAGWSKDHVEALFGETPRTEGQSDEAAEEQDSEWQRPHEPALLRIADARLPAAVRAALRGRPDLTRQLFTRLSTVKINPETGAAEHGALRMTGAVAPLSLEAEVTALAGAPPNWFALLDAACAVTLAVGGLKSDGLGRAVLRLRSPAHAAGDAA